MSNTLRTSTAAPQTRSQPQVREGFFGKIGRVLKETFATPELPAQKVVQTDNYTAGQPFSVAVQRRMALQNSGMKANRSAAASAASQDAQLVAYLNHISNTGDPSV
jgi:hypothetical protein